MICDACEFETDRLRVGEWHALSRDDDLARVVAGILTDPVTRSLPSSWRGSYSAERARAWIGDRDSEGSTLFVVEKATDQAIGLMILFETDADSVAGGAEIRLGYLLAEHAWGKGYVTELIRDFVRWCRGQTGIRCLVGGVERGNAASIRVLKKNGFQAVHDDNAAGGELFRLTLGS
jgi:RimJ/RimL family protein N-acetyltransferase